MGLKRDYIKLSFLTVNDLMKVKRYVWNVIHVIVRKVESRCQVNAVFSIKNSKLMQCNGMGDRRRWKTLLDKAWQWLCFWEVFGLTTSRPIQCSILHWGIVWAQEHFCHMRNFNVILITFTSTWRVVFSSGLNLIQHTNHGINLQ